MRLSRRRAAGDALLEPTRLYVRPLLAEIRAGGIKALAHITGGGLTENVPRILPDGLAAEIDLGAWPLHPVFDWLMREGGIQQSEMLRTFNCGVGMVVIASPDDATAIADNLVNSGEQVAAISRIVANPGEAQTLFTGTLG